MNASHSAANQRRILVSGGGIGGNAVALQLLRAGIRATVVERADAPRPGGQAVDLRGLSGEVAERMGLMPGIRNYQLDERGIVMVDSEGRTCCACPPRCSTARALSPRSSSPVAT
jgi:2-polyprenyl-6-methoxyphenol hydroxylase-like FAD-dependent oxidoreductase